MRKLRKILLLLTCSMAFTSCIKESDTPIGYVNFTIDPNSTFYYNLNNVGSYEYFIGGYKGVVIFRFSLTEFLAYERACPHCHEVAVEVNKSGLILECPQCGSQFVYTDGSPVKGPAVSVLRHYSTYYDGYNLHVFN